MEAVDMLRDEGYPVGLVRLRYVRPFPVEELRELASSVRAVLVVDRAVSMGHMGVIAGTSYQRYRGKVTVKNVIAGLGGVDVGPDDFKSMIKGFVEEYESGALDSWFYTEWYMPWVRRG
jgi:pyruvate/2-oxoacid:ferredoxin oxidoreductase alpha subunit